MTTYTTEAATMVAAIKALAENTEKLDNFEIYLSRHFSAWLEKYANTPENIASEFADFAEIE